MTYHPYKGSQKSSCLALYINVMKQTVIMFLFTLSHFKTIFLCRKWTKGILHLKDDLNGDFWAFETVRT